MPRRKRAVVFGLLAVVCSATFTQEETSYLAVFMEGKKVGHSVHTRRVEGASRSAGWGPPAPSK
jgi:hypothetical protein